MKHIAVLLLVIIGIGCQPSLQGSAQSRTLPGAGEPRSYILYVPEVKLSKPALVLVLHGLNGSGAAIRRRTRGTFDKLADRDGFIVAYPEGLRGRWNTGHAYDDSSADDVSYLSALIDKLTAEFHVDPARIYVTGLSKGAQMTYRLACERPDRIAAIAPVAGGLAQALMPACAAASTRPIPLLVIHGTEDEILRFDDGELEGNVQYWIRRNGCVLTPTVTRLPDIDPDDGTRTRVESYSKCTNGSDVALYAIEGGGHHWPGGNEPIRRDNGREIRDFDAAVVIWEFFNRHSMPAGE